jgi:hypothetical protein
MLEAVGCDPDDDETKTAFLESLPLQQAWSRRSHSLVFASASVPVGKAINVLFATLLLGLQRLEAAGVLPLAHHSMLEDTLEC